MKTINIETRLGMVTRIDPTSDTIGIRMDAADILSFVSALSELKSKDDRFNKAIKIIENKMMQVNCCILADIYVSKNTI